MKRLVQIQSWSIACFEASQQQGTHVSEWWVRQIWQLVLTYNTITIVENSLKLFHSFYPEGQAVSDHHLVKWNKRLKSDIKRYYPDDKVIKTQAKDTLSLLRLSFQLWMTKFKARLSFDTGQPAGNEDGRQLSSLLSNDTESRACWASPGRGQPKNNWPASNRQSSISAPTAKGKRVSFWCSSIYWFAWTYKKDYKKLQRSACFCCCKTSVRKHLMVLLIIHEHLGFYLLCY